MSRLDLVIFGATGFTGKQAVIELARIAQKNNVTWAVAGRNEAKLKTVLQEAEKKSGEDLSGIQILKAEVSDEKSLQAMCSAAKVVVNCCGPYRLYGEPVVRAAIAERAHYVDVSGEPQFIETMQLLYDKEAKDAGVYIVSACGFDSIPNDLGVAFMQQQFDGTLNSVESYVSMFLPPEHNTGGAFIHYGTWESLVYGLAHHGELAPLRKKLYPERLPAFHPKLGSRGIHYRLKTWCVPFMGADASIVYRSQRHAYNSEGQRPVQFKPYVRVGGFPMLVVSLLAGAMLFLMSKTAFTIRLLLNHPRLFSFGFVSRDGPSEEVMQHSYYKFQLFGEGWSRGRDPEGAPDKKMLVKVSGLNPGYGATVSALIYSALTILKEKEKMPPQGGVLTTATAFKNTDLVKNLYDNNMRFEVIDPESTSVDK